MVIRKDYHGDREKIKWPKNRFIVFTLDYTITVPGRKAVIW